MSRVSNENDRRVTVLGFTNSLGEPVICVVIFKASQLEYFEKYGIDIDAKYASRDDGDEDLEREMNTGPGRWFPGGPVCKYKGKTLNTLAHASDGGGINSEILTEIFKKLD